MTNLPGSRSAAVQGCGQPFRHSTVRTATVLPHRAACCFIACARRWPGVAWPAGGGA